MWLGGSPEETVEHESQHVEPSEWDEDGVDSTRQGARVQEGGRIRRRRRESFTFHFHHLQWNINKFSDIQSANVGIWHNPIKL